MSYLVKEIVYTLQGEGANTGRPIVLCRFAGCNLWTGRQEDRSTAACRFCDTDFVGKDGAGGGRFEAADDLAGAVAAKWPAGGEPLDRRLVVCTGGEPLLQMDNLLVEALHARGFEVAVETNGTRASTGFASARRPVRNCRSRRATNSSSCFPNRGPSPSDSSTWTLRTGSFSRWTARSASAIRSLPSATASNIRAGG